MRKYTFGGYTSDCRVLGRLVFPKIVYCELPSAHSNQKERANSTQVSNIIERRPHIYTIL